MNLSLILTMPKTGNASAAGFALGAATPSQASISPEMASFQDFLAVVGLSPMALEAPVEEGGEALPDEAALLAANDTGNILPPALPVSPEVAASLFQPMHTAAQPVAEIPAAAPGSPSGQSAPVATTRRPHPATLAAAPAQVPSAITPQGSVPVTGSIPSAAGQLQTQAAIPATAQATTGQAQAPAPAPAPAALEIELVLPSTPVQAGQVQVAQQPVLAQLLNTPPRPTARKASDEAMAPAAIPAAPTTEPTTEPTEAPRAATAAPVAPVTVPAAIMAAAPDMPSAQPTAATTTTIAAAETPARHDFAAVIDKLAEARELARPGRADMHLLHREFGQVSVQFELAGQALKVAMSSPDAAFAPAVQAALAERPIAAVADAARTDPNAPRADTVTAANASWQAGPQAEGQRGDGQRGTQQSRSARDVVQQQHEGDAAGARQSAADRDGSRFA